MLYISVANKVNRVYSIVMMCGCCSSYQLTGNLVDRQLLVVSLLSAHNRRVGSQREVDPGVGHQVGLELCQINVQSSVKSEGCCDRGNYLT